MQFGVSTDSIIMNEAVQAFTSNGFCLSSLTSFLAKMPRILALIAVKRCIENSSELLSPLITSLKTLIVNTLYRTKKYSTSDVLKEDYHIASVIVAAKEPQYIVESNANEVVVKYLPFLHSKLISTIEETGRAEYERSVKSRSNKKALCESFELQENNTIKTVTCAVSSLYPSSNYRKLAKMISSHFEISQKIGTRKVLGVLIDGVPGLGKTMFADYATSQRLASNVYKIDMTSFRDVAIEAVFKSIYHSRVIVNETILVIDELDKYIDARLQTEFRSQKPEEGSAPLGWEEFVSYRKLHYLYEMLRILERKNINASVIVLFCSNNFKSIFEGVDVTHHRSLYDRFMKVNFEKCDHGELVDYLCYYNNKLEGSEYYSDITREEIEKKLRPDISITFRALDFLSIQAMYNISALVDLLNTYEEDVLESGVISKYSTPTVLCLEKKIPSTTRELRFEEKKEGVVEGKEKEKEKKMTDAEAKAFLIERCKDIEQLNPQLRDQAYTKLFEEVRKNQQLEDKIWGDQNVRSVKLGQKFLDLHNRGLIDDSSFIDNVDAEHTSEDILNTLMYRADATVKQDPQSETKKASALKHITSLMDKFGTASGSGEQIKVINDLFSYIASDTFAKSLVFNNPNLLVKLQGKANEFINDETNPFGFCDDRTKHFIYALTGVWAW
jgi:SpoVK/Ycf46/Vps4 family AAA+-type ATPase